MNNVQLMDKFLGILRDKYPTVIFRYEYQEDDGWYKVWHTYENAFEDNMFKEFIGKCIKDFLMPQGMHKVYFDINLDYIEALNNQTSWQAVRRARIGTYEFFNQVPPSYLSQVFAEDRLINIKMLANVSQKHTMNIGFQIQDAKVEKTKEYAEDIVNNPIVKKAQIIDSSSFINNQDFGCPQRVSGSDCESQA